MALTEARAQGWRTLAALQSRIEVKIERALQDEHGLSVNEFCGLHQGLTSSEPSCSAVFPAAPTSASWSPSRSGT
ncbi:hypothetical protein ACIBHX_32110 [Nonomuraea sp. NPDC050536]|uniref:hypothetical protein n=1 Tax=Nonomuraea sp. NPDC050536 TaxID=3364366 RepID=UPI0037CA5926